MPVAEIIKDAWFGSGRKAGREGESLVGLVGVGEVGRDGRMEHSEALPGEGASSEAASLAEETWVFRE